MAIKNVGKVAIGWGVIVAAGVSAFVLAKKSIDSGRYENMKIRERIRNASLGENYPAAKSVSSSNK